MLLMRLLTSCRTRSSSSRSRSYFFLGFSSSISTPRLLASSSSICLNFLFSNCSVLRRIHSKFSTLLLTSSTRWFVGKYFSTFRLGEASAILSLISVHRLISFLSIKIKASPSLLARAVLPALWTQVSPLTGTPTWTTWVIWKSSPRAATSVAMRMLKRVDFLNFSILPRRCFCCMWECRLTTFIPKAQMKYWMRLQALMVLEKTMVLQPAGRSFRQQISKVIRQQSPSVKAILSTNFSGRKRSELRSTILGFQENCALERRAFNLGMVYSIFSSFSLSSLFLPLPVASLSLSFRFCLRSSLFCFHQSSVLVFLMKYLVPLNYLVRVAETKKILRLSLARKLISGSVSLVSFILGALGAFCSFCSFSFFAALGFGLNSSAPVILNIPSGTSKS